MPAPTPPVADLPPDLTAPPDNAPPPEPPQPDEDEGKPGISLSSDQLEAAGVQDLSIGDTFTVTIHGTVTNVGEDGTVEADVTGAENGSKADKEPDAAEGSEPNAPEIPLKNAKKKPMQNVKSPSDLGLED